MEYVRSAAERIAFRSRTYRLSEQNTFGAKRNVTPRGAERYAARSRTYRLSKWDVLPPIGEKGRGMRAVQALW